MTKSFVTISDARMDPNPGVPRACIFHVNVPIEPLIIFLQRQRVVPLETRLAIQLEMNELRPCDAAKITHVESTLPQMLSHAIIASGKQLYAVFGCSDLGGVRDRYNYTQQYSLRGPGRKSLDNVVLIREGEDSTFAVNTPPFLAPIYETRLRQMGISYSADADGLTMNRETFGPTGNFVTQSVILSDEYAPGISAYFRGLLDGEPVDPEIAARNARLPQCKEGMSRYFCRAVGDALHYYAQVETRGRCR